MYMVKYVENSLPLTVMYSGFQEHNSLEKKQYMCQMVQICVHQKLSVGQKQQPCF